MHLHRRRHHAKHTSSRLIARGWIGLDFRSGLLKSIADQAAVGISAASQQS
jgi:hypothetical protein